RATEARGREREAIRLRQQATEAEVLRRTDEARSALLHAVSPDLRTPLASIVASAGTLRQDNGLPSEERAELAESIEEQAARLNRIVGNLLDLSRIEAGGLRPERDWYDLDDLITDIVGHIPNLDEENVRVEVPEDLPPVLLDYIEIQQVLVNLLENAMKYAGGNQVEVVARRQDGLVEVEVSDRGPGIPSGSLAYLFEPFYRGEAAARRSGGTGLG